MKRELTGTNTTKTNENAIARNVIRAMSGILAFLFLLSATMNLGYKIPLGSFATLSFSSPSSTIATFEIVIGSLLLISATLSNFYVYGGGLLLGTIGIIEGLLSSEVQGLARYIHETMIPSAIIGWAFLIYGARKSSYDNNKKKNKDNLTASEKNRDILTVLQFFVGGLVTLGGAALTASGTYPVGTLLGSIHLAVGLGGLYGGYAFFKRKTWSARFLIIINVLAIAYSAFAETLAEIYAYLRPGINDAFIGTIIAIIVSSVIIYMVASGKSKRSKFSQSALSPEPSE